jgi:hypothetical protein
MGEQEAASAYTGVRREGPSWTIYLRGREVGECVRFTEAQTKLAEVTAADAQPLQETAPTPPAVSGPQRVTIVAIGRRDWPGSRIVRDERLELVQVDNGEARPPKKPMTLNTVLDWLERQGLAPEATTSTGMAVWTPLDGGRGNVEARRRCVFVRATA